MRIVRLWHAGRLLQQQWTYRIIEEDGTYSLQVKPEHESDDKFASAIGHLLANRLAEEIILNDRLWLFTEEEAHQEDEYRNKVVNIREIA